MKKLYFLSFFNSYIEIIVGDDTFGKKNNLFILILTIGVFGILNTEMGIVGILPSIADHFRIGTYQKLDC